MTLPAPPSPRQLRSELLERTEADLLGPWDGPDEVLPTYLNPQDRYLVGMLAPSGQKLELDEGELEVQGSNEPEQPATELAPITVRTLFPSSFGLSFCVDESCQALHIELRYGRYDRLQIQEADGSTSTRWVRTPVEGDAGLLHGFHICE